MKVVVKKKVVRNERIVVETDSLKLDLDSYSLKGLSVDPNFGRFLTGTVNFLDLELGEIEITIRPQCKEHEDNAKEALTQITSLFKGFD